MKPFSLGDITKGIDRMSDHTSLPKGAVLDAKNVDLDRYGNIKSRPGCRKVADTPDADSLWSPSHQRWGLYRAGNALRRVDVNGGALSATTLLSGVANLHPMRYWETQTWTAAVDGDRLVLVKGDGTDARFAGVEAPSVAPTLVAGVGGMGPGDYSLAISYMDLSGEESALSPMSTIHTEGGVALELPDPPAGVATVRVYCTATNGDILYLNAEVPAGVPSYVVADRQLSKQADTQFLTRMLGGTAVCVHGGRVFVARGSVLVYSEAFRYGLTDLRHNFVEFHAPIRMMIAVDSGVFVGTDHGVHFLKGDGPGKFEQSLVTTAGVVCDDAALLPISSLNEKMRQLSESPVAVWLGRAGFAFGMGSGAIVEPQAKQVLLPSVGRGNVVSLKKNGMTQVVAVVESTESKAYGVAAES